ncbi:MAG: DUF1015 domain-containing protein [Dehalococcoidia bacterium]|nr:DUF1015 domain-containing protein [Dehalococcoidia bacterium]
MPQFRPFRGIRYTAAAGKLDDLLAPPYDVISPADQRQLAGRSARNAVHLELADGGDERYAKVAALFSAWERDGFVQRDDIPMFYVYEQTFVEAGREYHRRALLAEVEAQPWDEGAVKPHEFTMSGPKEDRLKLLEATRVQFSPVFMIARDRAAQLRQFLDQTVAARPADAEATTIDGDRHRLWVIEAGRLEMRFLAPLLAESFYIADGHHRYETAVNYRNAMLEREGTLALDHPARFAMTAIVPAADPGLVIRPIHRIVPRRAPANWEQVLSESFAVESVKPIGGLADRAREFEARLAANPDSIVALNLDPGMAHILTPRGPEVAAAIAPAGFSAEWAGISPNLLRYGVLAPLWSIGDDDLRLGAVEYTHDAREAIERAEGDTAVFLISPVGIDSVMSLADQGERMPQKSTFFHPKLGTGIVFHPLYE